MQVFIPNCDRRSFEWTNFPPMDRQFEYEVLTSMLHTAPIRCPKNCVNYVSQRRVTLFRPVSKFWSLRRHILAPLQWFAKLPWQTQIAIIMLCILALAPKWIPMIIKLLAAYRGFPPK